MAHDFHMELDQLLTQGRLKQTAPRRVPREIRRSAVRLMDEIGSGEFGIVYKAKLDESEVGGVPEYTVAVKEVQSEDVQSAAIRDLYVNP